jgi:hypothetical protein
MRHAEERGREDRPVKEVEASTQFGAFGSFGEDGQTRSQGDGWGEIIALVVVCIINRGQGEGHLLEVLVALSQR